MCVATAAEGASPERSVLGEGPLRLSSLSGQAAMAASGLHLSAAAAAEQGLTGKEGEEEEVMEATGVERNGLGTTGTELAWDSLWEKREDVKTELLFPSASDETTLRLYVVEVSACTMLWADTSGSGRCASLFRLPLC
eukprot:GHVS01039336.1.p4 GENE.GHVS01039336.1~~GHVS01039336.1.p4  ORF type:complete len:138 (+),score=40.45 GHVS01039336.1:1600-2013(+)